MIVLALLFAVLGAFSNALGTAFLRKASVRGGGCCPRWPFALLILWGVLRLTRVVPRLGDVVG